MSTKALRLTDHERELRYGLTAASLDEFEERARGRLGVDRDQAVRVVLEMDGTEIDDEDYFETLEPHTLLMLLVEEQRWTPYKSNFVLGVAVDGVGASVEELVWRLHQDLSYFPWLTEEELERIAKMDREEMAAVVPDGHFLDFLHTLCERYLAEKGKGENAGKTSSLLNDPLRLIRLYAKFSAKSDASFSLCSSQESLLTNSQQNN